MVDVLVELGEVSGRSGGTDNLASGELVNEGAAPDTLFGGLYSLQLLQMSDTSERTASMSVYLPRWSLVSMVVRSIGVFTICG